MITCLCHMLHHEIYYIPDVTLGMKQMLSKNVITKIIIVSAGKHFSNTNLSDLSIVGTCDIFVY